MNSNSSRWIVRRNGLLRRSARARRHSRHRAASRSGRHCWRTVERMPSAPTSRSASTLLAVGKMRHAPIAPSARSVSARRRGDSAPAERRRAAAGRRAPRRSAFCGHSISHDRCGRRASRILRVGDLDAEVRRSSRPSARSARDHLRLGDDAGAAAGQLALDALVDVDVPTRAGAACRPASRPLIEPPITMARLRWPRVFRSVGSPSAAWLYIVPTTVGGMPWR